jgi:hypothetical protein
MTKDIYSALKKKKSNSVTIPTKQKQDKPKPKTVKHHKAKPAKVQPQQQVQQQAQQLNPADFTLSTTADVNRIQITCNYRGRAVNVFRLPSNVYASWQRSNFEQKFNYFLHQTNARAFGNDSGVIQAVIFQAIQIIDSMFARAAQQAQQAQAQAQAQRRI